MIQVLVILMMSVLGVDNGVTSSTPMNEYESAVITTGNRPNSNGFYKETGNTEDGNGHDQYGRKKP